MGVGHCAMQYKLPYLALFCRCSDPLLQKICSKGWTCTTSGTPLQGMSAAD
jgi:hypothetical protein